MTRGFGPGARAEPAAEPAASTGARQALKPWWRPFGWRGKTAVRLRAVWSNREHAWLLQLRGPKCPAQRCCAGVQGETAAGSRARRVPPAPATTRCLQPPTPPLRLPAQPPAPAPYTRPQPAARGGPCEGRQARAAVGGPRRQRMATHLMVSRERSIGRAAGSAATRLIKGTGVVGKEGAGRWVGAGRHGVSAKGGGRGHQGAAAARARRAAQQQPGSGARGRTRPGTGQPLRARPPRARRRRGSGAAGGGLRSRLGQDRAGARSAALSARAARGRSARS
jgi:hypothetical protein